MSVRPPHYLLFSEAKLRQRTMAGDVAGSTDSVKNGANPARNRIDDSAGQWRFVLQAVEGEEQFEAVDDESGVQPDRLELLAVVRGLEALDQPSRVTLVTRSRYVSRGLRHGIREWRENGWKWEHYGDYQPVNNYDLWQRVDHAMNYHKVECRTWRFDASHAPSDQESTEVTDAAGNNRDEPSVAGHAHPSQASPSQALSSDERADANRPASAIGDADSPSTQLSRIAKRMASRVGQMFARN